VSSPSPPRKRLIRKDSRHSWTVSHRCVRRYSHNTFFRVLLTTERCPLVLGAPQGRVAGTTWRGERTLFLMREVQFCPALTGSASFRENSHDAVSLEKKRASDGSPGQRPASGNTLEQTRRRREEKSRTSHHGTQRARPLAKRGQPRAVLECLPFQGLRAASTTARRERQRRHL